MKKLTAITILILSVTLPTVFGQNTLTQKLVDKHWGINKYNISEPANSDTLLLDKRDDKASTLTNPYIGGFIFHQDGNFTEILHHSCNYDRQAYSGDWHLHDNTVIVKIKEDLTWYFQIIAITDDKLTTKHWTGGKK